MSPNIYLWRNWFRSRIAFAACLAVVLLAVPGHLTQPMIAQNEIRGHSAAGDMECISYCSTTRPGALLMKVRMRLANLALKDANLRSAVSRQGLEVTVYSDGFERGLYATVPAIKPKALFRARTRDVGLAPVIRAAVIPGLENLVITDVATRLDKQAKPFLLMQPEMTRPPTATEEGEWVTVRLEGMDPGMAYTFRLPSGRSAVTCQAVLCPVDIIPGRPKRGKRRPR